MGDHAGEVTCYEYTHPTFVIGRVIMKIVVPIVVA
jgi:hypothetical protein